MQFAVDEGGLFCEVVHNKYLAPEHAFTGDDIAKLPALGFGAPDHEDQNLFRVFQPATDDDYSAIVSVVRTVVTDCRRDIHSSWEHPGNSTPVRSSAASSRGTLGGD